MSEDAVIESVPFAPRHLEDGRCCGRKPLTYRRPQLRYFCLRCAAQFGADGTQQANWKWQAVTGGFLPRSERAPEPYSYWVAYFALPAEKRAAFAEAEKRKRWDRNA